MATTWQFFQNTGLVEEACFPYTSGGGKVEACRTTCVNGAAWKTYKVSSYAPYTNPTAIKNELYANGPLHTGFIVYSDFMNYKSGVYVHTSGSRRGGHAVVIVGYGKENGIELAGGKGNYYGDNAENCGGFFHIVHLAGYYTTVTPDMSNAG